MLQVEHLAVTKGDDLLFSDISFVAEAGSIWRIYGANGAGKTTLLRAILGLTRTERGVVRWNDIDTLSLESTFERDSAYLGHLPPLKLSLTAEENLKFSQLSYKRSGLSIDEALHQVGMLRKADVVCRHLSAGQKRRVALAALAMKDVRLWVLDEPLTGLDTDGQALVTKMIQAHCDKGNIVVFTAHQDVTVEGHNVQGVQL